MNVMMTASGPVVIDWTNAARAIRCSTSAVTFILLTCPRIPGSNLINVAVATGARRVGSRVREALPRPRVRSPARAARPGSKSLDTNMSPDEMTAIERAGGEQALRIAR